MDDDRSWEAVLSSYFILFYFVFLFLLLTGKSKKNVEPQAGMKGHIRPARPDKGDWQVWKMRFMLFIYISPSLPTGFRFREHHVSLSLFFFFFNLSASIGAK